MLQSAVAEKSLCAWQTLFDMVEPFNYTHNSRRGSNALREKFFRIVPLPCEGNKSGVEEQSQSELIADTIWYGPCNLAPTITNRWGYIPEGSYILWPEDMWEAFISCVTKDPPSTFSSAKVSTMLPLRDLIFSHNPVSEVIGHEVRALEKVFVQILKEIHGAGKLHIGMTIPQHKDGCVVLHDQPVAAHPTSSISSSVGRTVWASALEIPATVMRIAPLVKVSAI